MSRLNIVMYHYVRDLDSSRYPQIKGLDYNLFKKQIQFFSENFQVIRMEDVLSYYEGGSALPENALLLTFDDGYLDNYTYVFPVLAEYKMQGSFFIPAKTFCENCVLDVNKIHFTLASAPIGVLVKELSEQLDFYRGGEWNYPSNEELFAEYAVSNRFDSKETIFFKRILQAVLPEDLRGMIADYLFRKYVGVSEKVLAHELYLSCDQIKVMKQNGMFFGVHGYNHYWMNRLTERELEADIDMALDALDGIVDRKRWVINYPYGSYSTDVVSLAKRKGCVLGLATDVRVADLEKDDRFLLPRLDTNDYPPKSDNYLKRMIDEFKEKI